MEGQAARLKDLIRDIPDFPRPGVVFKDLTPLLADGDAFAYVVSALVEHFGHRGATKVVGVEARGFIVAAPVAVALGAGFVPVRKAGKLPWQTHAETYTLEYGTDALEVHIDAVGPGDHVVVVDDVLATGGTAAATVALVERLGASVAGLGFVIELGFLNGRRRLAGHDLVALVSYE
jgi:adenine phosphoribosyltransferase